MAKLHRNDVCSCGSNKKYKRCCLIKIENKKRIANQKRNEAFRAVYSSGTADVEQNKLVRADLYKYMRELFG